MKELFVIQIAIKKEEEANNILFILVFFGRKHKNFQFKKL